MKLPPNVSAILRPLVWVLATVYFLIDAVFVSLIRPIGKWVGFFPAFLRLEKWIQSLGRYQSLIIFIVPLIVLEPVKPISLYLIATGKMAEGILLLLIGETIKILLLERLFHITRPKLMTFSAFEWAYNRVVWILEYFQSLPAWKSVRSRFQEIRTLIRRKASDRT